MFPLGVWKEEKLVRLQIEIIKMESTEFVKLNSSPLSPAAKFYGFEKRFFHDLQCFSSFHKCRSCTKTTETLEYSLNAEV